MTTMVSATSIASSWSWVTNTVVTWVSSCSRRSHDPQLLAHPRIERAERLVEQQHLRLHGQRAGERHALALAARQLGRVAVGELVDLDELEQLARPLRWISSLGRFRMVSPKATLSEHGHVLERRVVLEHEADAPLLGRDAGHVAVAEPDRRRRRASRARR